MKLERERRIEEPLDIGWFFDQFALDRLDIGGFPKRGSDDDEAVGGNHEHLLQPFMEADGEAVDLFMGIENTGQRLVFASKPIEIIDVEFLHPFPNRSD